MRVKINYPQKMTEKTISEKCEHCCCEDYTYNRDKTISANGTASYSKQYLKRTFHFCTGYYVHRIATCNRCDCGHREDDHK